MNVSLTPDLEKFVHEQVESGTYPSASEVVREGLRLLLERDERRARKLEALRQEILIGIEQAEQGRVQPLTQELVEELKARGRKRLDAMRGQAPS